MAHFSLWVYTCIRSTGKIAAYFFLCLHLGLGSPLCLYPNALVLMLRLMGDGQCGLSNPNFKLLFVHLQGQIYALPAKPPLALPITHTTTLCPCIRLKSYRTLIDPTLCPRIRLESYRTLIGHILHPCREDLMLLVQAIRLVAAYFTYYSDDAGMGREQKWVFLPRTWLLKMKFIAGKQ